MSNDKQQQSQPKPQRPAEGNGREPIPVGVIRTHRPANFPGAEANMSLKARREGSKEWQIHWLPWMRCYQVTFLREGDSPIVRNFPEGGVESWDPPEGPS